MTRQNKLPKVSRVILNLIVRNVKKTDRMLEIGCASAHISAELQSLGFSISGIEIRPDAVANTKKNLPSFNIQQGDVLQHDDKYDAVWCSGLIQCLDDAQKRAFFGHCVNLAPKAIFIVPERLDYLPPAASDFKVAVSGCEEFPTGNIPFMLSDYYDNIRIGKWPAADIGLEIPFIYYICTK
ncbi:hypothetical protein FACS1894186_2710 [Alphaproteobacteria bacterium]|nr:hypothetical protein FACS1894186_2710 [Alphaproteobacteria bacterium]